MNESIIRLDNQMGTLGATLASGDVTSTITFSTAPNFPAITTNTFAKLILEPGSSGQEIVYLTSYAVGSLTGTVLRGQEGTASRYHPQSAIWQHGPTAADFNPSIDTPWGGDLGYDYNFSSPHSTSPPSGWTWVNQGTATYVEQYGAGVVTCPTNTVSTNTQGRLIYRSLPSSWSTITTKLSAAFPQANYAIGGLALYSTSSTKAIITGPCYDGGGGPYVIFCNGISGGSAGAQAVITPSGYAVDSYYQVVRHSATSVDFNWSPDGIAWMPITSGYNLANFDSTINSVGLIGDPQGPGYACQWAMHWLRIR